MAGSVIEGSFLSITGVVRRVDTPGGPEARYRVLIDGMQVRGGHITLTAEQVGAKGVKVVANVFKPEDNVTHRSAGGKGYVVAGLPGDGYRVAWVRAGSLVFEAAAGDLLLPYTEPEALFEEGGVETAELLLASGEPLPASDVPLEG